MATQPVGTSGFSPSALVAQGAQSAQVAPASRATAEGAVNASRDDVRAVRTEQQAATTQAPQTERPTQEARQAPDARTEQLRTERDQEQVRAASNEIREREDNTYTAAASAARFGGGQTAGSMVDLRA
jgi:flagellar biosynthesis GTPase FlhF